MKQVMLILAVAAMIVVVAGVLTAEGETAWIDPPNCSMCKHMANEDGLLENMEWEIHLISNGALMFTHVPESHKAAFERAHKHMQDVGAKMMGGEKLPLCGFCRSYGELIMAGAEVENVEGEVVSVNLLTSADEEIVEKIRAHAQKTMDEYRQYKQGLDAKAGTRGG